MKKCEVPVAAVPVYDVDFYCDEFVLDPFLQYTAMREIGGSYTCRD